MDGYIPHPPAQDSATSGYSSAAKGGLAGVLVMLLTIVVYVFFKRRKCSVRIEVDVEMQKGASMLGNKEESMKYPDASTAPF